MGKTKKPRRRSKVNPVGDDSMDDDAGELYDKNGDPLPTRPVEAVRSQLLNGNVEEKLNGLQALAVLASSRDKVADICDSDVVRIVAPLLCEHDEAVRNAAAGALRNLSVCSPDVCEHLVHLDVMTPLLTLLAEYTLDVVWRPTFDVSMGGQLDLHSDVFLQAINLLWNLCESTDVALDVFNQTQLLAGIVRYLEWRVFGMDIAISVAQCLLVVSENNPKSWNILINYLPDLLSLMCTTPAGIPDAGHAHAYLRTLAAGILANVPALYAANVVAILEALGRTLEADHRVALSNYGRKVGPRIVEAPELEMDADEETDEAAALRRRREELPTAADIAVRDLGYLLDAQRVAAEVVTNLCIEEDACADVDFDQASESESVVDAKSDDDDSYLDDDSKLPEEVVEAIKSIGLVDMLWQRAQPIADEVAQQLRESNISLLMKAKNLRISSLLSLQNMCNSLDTEVLGGPNAIYAVWVDLGQQVFKGLKDQSLLEPSTSLMRSALVHLRNNRELFSQMTESDLELMLNCVTNCTMPEIRANWLHMLGGLGFLLPEPLVKIIITFIVQICAEEEDAWTMSEAIDALMEIFADNNWNQLVLDLNLLKLIPNIEKSFKSTVRQQRRELSDRYPAVQTVQTNLKRFIAYMTKTALSYEKEEKNKVAAMN